MIGKPLFYLALFVGSLLGPSASAVTTSKNVDIIVTHGAPLTTFTFVNNTGATLPAGAPVSMGQAFRYGDIMPGNYPVIRDAVTHVPLAGQQWDEISTWRENGGNGSWRHAVWAIWLPKSLAAGASYQIEFVATAGTYSQTSHQLLSALCSGPGAHDFKIHLSDVRNQDDTKRDSGDATFRLCDNIANTGRDAPRHLRAGNVYDEYEVRGLFKYTSGHQDPLLYVTAVVDLFTDAADRTSLKDVRHVFTTHNSWENVAAGTAGNSGNPGPVGFANDPQVLSYQPQILDGSTDILDWSGLTQTVSSASTPIGANCSDTWQGSVTMTVPGSTGTNVWWAGMPVRVSTTGTPVGGLTAGQLYWVYNCGSSSSTGVNTQYVSLMNTPQPASRVATPLTNSQGSGTTTFTYVMWHPHWQSWQDEDTSADQNWATRGSTARFTRRIYPAFTNAEKTYWEETGLVPPMYLGQPSPTVQISYNGANLYPLYNPFAKGVVIGTTGPSQRPDLGFINEYAAQAFVDGTENNWFWSRLYTMGAQNHGASTLLDESTGRIPVLNNGPPTGPGGNGVGGSYGPGGNASIALGAPQNQTSWSLGYFHGLAQPRANTPNTLIDWRCGIWLGCGTYISHIPNFVSLSYLIFGERLYLDSTYFDPNRDLLQLQPGVGDSYRDDIITSGAGTNHYWGLTIACCQARGSAWALRDRTFAGALGGDGNIERQYYNDQITENLNYYAVWVNPYKSGPGNTNIQTSIMPPDFPASWEYPDTYIGGYIFEVAYGMQTFLHAIDFNQWITPFTRYYDGVCGGQMAGHPVSFYCIDFSMSIAMYDGDHTTFGADVGPAVNGTDASSFGGFQSQTNILTGGQLQYGSRFGYYTLAPGDTVRSINGNLGDPLIDQLPGTQWFSVIGPIDNTNGTFYIQCPLGHAVTSTCPTPGAAFTDFTHGGVSIAGATYQDIIYRPSFDPGPGVGYADNNYTQYGGMVMNGLTILGQNVSHGLADFTARGGPGFYNQSQPGEWWDNSVVVPGSP